MTKTLKSIDPLQAGKILGIIYALLSLIFVPFFLLFSMIGMLLPHQAGAPNLGAFGIAGGLALIVIIPIVYGAMGFIGGVVGAWLYNIVAKWIGGLKFEVE